MLDNKQSQMHLKFKECQRWFICCRIYKKKKKKKNPVDYAKSDDPHSD